MWDRFAFEDADNFVRNLVTVRLGGPHGTRTSPPARKMERVDGLPVELADLMADLRIDSDDEEATLTRMERGACEFLERRTGHVTMPGAYQVILTQWWNGPLEVMRGPFRELTHVDYLAEGGTWTPIDTDRFWIDERERDFGITALSTFDRPALWREVSRIRLTFTAGYQMEDESGSGTWPAMPDGLRTTLIMLVGHFYQNRELFAAGKVAEVEMSAGNILSAYRQFW